MKKLRDWLIQNKKYLPYAAAGAVCIVIIIIFILLFYEKDRIVSVMETIGTVLIQRENQPKGLPVFNGMRLKEGDYLKTEEASSVTMLIDKDKLVRLEENSEAGFKEIVNAKGEQLTSIDLKKGTLINDIKTRANDNITYEVTTPNATISIRGTYFVVYVGEEEGYEGLVTKVNVYAGVVAVEHSNGQVTILTGDGVADGIILDEGIYLPSGNRAIIGTELIQVLKGVDFDGINEKDLDRLIELVKEGRSSLTVEEIEVYRQELLAPQLPEPEIGETEVREEEGTEFPEETEAEAFQEEQEDGQEQKAESQKKGGIPSPEVVVVDAEGSKKAEKSRDEAAGGQQLGTEEKNQEDGSDRNGIPESSMTNKNDFAGNNSNSTPDKNKEPGGNNGGGSSSGSGSESSSGSGSESSSGSGSESSSGSGSESSSGSGSESSSGSGSESSSGSGSESSSGSGSESSSGNESESSSGNEGGGGGSLEEQLAQEKVTYAPALLEISNQEEIQNQIDDLKTKTNMLKSAARDDATIARLEAVDQKVAQAQAALDAALSQVQTVNVVQELINGLRYPCQVDNTDRGAIEAARAAYDALSDADKAVVAERSKAKLEACEAALAAAVVS